MTKGRLDFDEDAWTELKALVAQTSIGTPAELIQRAVGLYRWAHEKHAAGLQIAAVDQDGAAQTILEADYFT